MSILENKFYNEKPYLTANKLMAGEYKLTRDYIKENNAITCILTFCNDLSSVLKTISNKVIKLDSIKAGEDLHPIYAINNILFILPFVGGPAAATMMEELAELGVKNFIACGSAGLINENFDSNKLLIVKEAVRDEGTSYHYASPEISAIPDDNLTKAIENTFKTLNINYDHGKVWTTDAFYRETPSAIKNNINNNIIAVDMECATWCIVSKKLNVKFSQFLYFSDSVCNENWDFVSTSDERINTKLLITTLAYKIAQSL